MQSLPYLLLRVVMGPALYGAPEESSCQTHAGFPSLTQRRREQVTYLLPVLIVSHEHLERA
jgi:hypothetical protein